MLAIPGGQSQAQGPHLLLTEIGIRLPPSEPGTFSYVEIANIADTTAPLENVYISSAPDLYPRVAEDDGSINFYSGAQTEWCFRFPPGTRLQSGQVAVICRNGTDLLDTFFGGDLANYTAQPGTPLLFEVVNDGDSVPHMSTNTSFGVLSLYTSGGAVILFTWDQQQDRSQDLDFVRWGGIAPELNKDSDLPAGIDGPDGNSSPTAFLPDAATGTIVAPTEIPYLLWRIDNVERGEILSGGNGISGHDESSENLASTWAFSEAVPDDSSPGIFVLPTTPTPTPSPTLTPTLTPIPTPTPSASPSPTPSPTKTPDPAGMRTWKSMR